MLLVLPYHYQLMDKLTELVIPAQQSVILIYPLVGYNVQLNRELASDILIKLSFIQYCNVKIQSSNGCTDMD